MEENLEILKECKYVTRFLFYVYSDESNLWENQAFCFYRHKEDKKIYIKHIAHSRSFKSIGIVALEQFLEILFDVKDKVWLGSYPREKNRSLKVRLKNLLTRFPELKPELAIFML